MSAWLQSQGRPSRWWDRPAGKTTLISLLSPSRCGRRRHHIDGRDITELRRPAPPTGRVLQDPFLFAETVTENIRYGRLDATDEEVIAAAQLANADHFIRRLPEGYDTLLSERGGNLSQGQRQLLSIARAVLADPRILVLDEATSSVDTRTEIHIQEALLWLMEGRTSFVIAHRLSTIRGADLILVIRDGEIVEQGAHEALLAQHGFYHQLYMSQFRGAEPPNVG
jgi:ATP-binding cassette subfamily B protein